MITAFKSCDKRARFADMVEAVQHCNLCPRLCSRTKVLSAKNGNLDSKVLFVAEAPGRLGADRTGIPLHGDQTGSNFEKLLGTVGWNRDLLFITNAVLCNPREENGNNGTPSLDEISNCVYYLAMTIELVNPDVVVSLGATALRALEIVSPHGLSLREAVGEPKSWASRLLVPMYHPGPRALVHRNFPKQTADFLRLAKVVKPDTGLVRSRKPRTGVTQSILPGMASPFQHLVCMIVQRLGRITYFQLTKLLYLIDLTSIQRIGRSLTGEIYLRQQEGPWPPALQKLVPPLNGWEIKTSVRGRIPLVEPGEAGRFQAEIDSEFASIVDEVLEQYGTLTNAQIKTVAYKTAPMRYLLSQEREGRDIRRVPVIYKDKCAPDTDLSKP